MNELMKEGANVNSYLFSEISKLLIAIELDCKLFWT